MTTAAARANLKLRDHQAVELAVPAHMMFLMIEELRKKGFELRADVLQHLNLAAVLPLAKLDELSVSRVARRIEDVATTLLRDLNADDPRHAIYVCAMFVQLLVDRALDADVRSQAVLVSLLLIDDIKDDRPDVNGDGVVWRLEEQKWTGEAKQLLLRANLMGLYLRDNGAEIVQLSA